MKTFAYRVTFEKPETGPPETVRGEIAAGSAYRALSLAYREASRRCPRKHWDDVVVLLEKADAPADRPAAEGAAHA